MSCSIKSVFSFLSSADKTLNAASVRLTVYSSKSEAGIMAENLGNYPANNLTAKLTIMQKGDYPFGPDPIPLKWGNKASIDLAGQDKDYLQLCIKEGKKFTIADGREINDGTYDFEVDLFGSNITYTKINAKIGVKKGKVKVE